MKDFYDILVPDRSIFYIENPVDTFFSCLTKEIIASSPKLFLDKFNDDNLRLSNIPIRELIHY